MILSFIITLLLVIYVIDWQYFRIWVAVFFFQCTLDFILGSTVHSLRLLEYPVRLLPKYFETSILFEIWAFPVLCILYNQTTRTRGLGGIIGHALLFSAGITAIEYPLELYTNLIKYSGWSWFATFSTLTLSLLVSKIFVTFYRRGCIYFSKKI
nr:CBO0543 family protein [Sporomusa acidovorans]